MARARVLTDTSCGLKWNYTTGYIPFVGAVSRFRLCIRAHPLFLTSTLIEVAFVAFAATSVEIAPVAILLGRQ